MSAAVQIEDYKASERNPYNHLPGDTIAHMNMNYVGEQIKASVAIAAHLAGLIDYDFRAFLPVITKTPAS